MIIDYRLLLVALLLLWLPRHWLRLGKKLVASPKTRQQSRDDRVFNQLPVELAQVFGKVRNWVDFCRAAVGSLAVGTVCFQPGVDDAVAGHRTVLIVQSLVLIIAVTIQTVRYQGRLTLFAPLFFVFGLSFGLVGWQAAAFAFVTVWLGYPVFKKTGLILFFYAVLVLVYGVVLAHAPLFRVILACFLALLPLLLSATTNRRFTQLNKKNKPVRS